MNDLTEGWPPDADNPELARFAEAMQRSLPQLSDESLERIGDTVSSEAARRTQKRWPWVRAALAVAAILLLAIAWTAPKVLFRPPTAPPTEWVTDSFPVELARPPAAVAPDRPLVRLDENQSLFTD